MFCNYTVTLKGSVVGRRIHIQPKRFASSSFGKDSKPSTALADRASPPEDSESHLPPFTVNCPAVMLDCDITVSRSLARQQTEKCCASDLCHCLLVISVSINVTFQLRRQEAARNSDPVRWRQEQGGWSTEDRLVVMRTYKQSKYLT